MKKTKYRLGNLIITEFDESLYTWEIHTALAELRSGNCHIIGNILIIDQWKYQESGYLILEFHEQLWKLPAWDKTLYYCSGSSLKDVTTGKELSVDKKHRFLAEADSVGGESVKFSDSNEFRLEKYKILIEKSGKVTWELYVADNGIDCGDCTIESGILFLNSKKANRYTNQSKKEWHHNTDLLPKWSSTKAWGHWKAVKNCSENKDLSFTNTTISRRKKFSGSKKLEGAKEQTRPNLDSRYNSILKQQFEWLKLRWLGYTSKKQQTEQLSHRNKVGHAMRKSVIMNDVVPFIVWFLLLISAVLSADYLLHKFQLAWVGKFLGIPGALMLVFSFIYSIKKRSPVWSGSIKTVLSFHIMVTWIGALLITVHAGIHFNAILPWAAYISMLVVVISGLVGEYLLKDARKTLRVKYTNLLDQGYSKEQVEKKVFLDSLTVKAMVNWRSVHKPISSAFGILAAFHIITILMFWGWFK